MDFADTALAADAELPDTGVGLELERRLSPPFVMGDTYGRYCCTLVLADLAGIEMTERRFGENQHSMAVGDSCNEKLECSVVVFVPVVRCDRNCASGSSKHLNRTGT